VTIAISSRRSKRPEARVPAPMLVRSSTGRRGHGGGNRAIIFAGPIGDARSARRHRQNCRIILRRDVVVGRIGQDGGKSFSLSVGLPIPAIPAGVQRSGVVGMVLST